MMMGFGRDIVLFSKLSGVSLLERALVGVPYFLGLKQKIYWAQEHSMLQLKQTRSQYRSGKNSPHLTSCHYLCTYC